MSGLVYGFWRNIQRKVRIERANGAAMGEVASSSSHFSEAKAKPKLKSERQELEKCKYGRLQRETNAASTYCIYNLAPVAQLCILLI